LDRGEGSKRGGKRERRGKGRMERGGNERGKQKADYSTQTHGQKLACGHPAKSKL